VRRQERQRGEKREREKGRARDEGGWKNRINWLTMSQESLLLGTGGYQGALDLTKSRVQLTSEASDQGIPLEQDQSTIVERESVCKGLLSLT